MAETVVGENDVVSEMSPGESLKINSGVGGWNWNCDDPSDRGSVCVDELCGSGERSCVDRL